MCYSSARVQVKPEYFFMKSFRDFTVVPLKYSTISVRFCTCCCKFCLFISASCTIKFNWVASSSISCFFSVVFVASWSFDSFRYALGWSFQVFRSLCWSWSRGKNHSVESVDCDYAIESTHTGLFSSDYLFTALLDSCAKITSNDILDPRYSSQ